MSERETQLAEVEIGRCHVCAQLPKLRKTC
jgi:hypothetical protein